MYRFRYAICGVAVIVLMLGAVAYLESRSRARQKLEAAANAEANMARRLNTRGIQLSAQGNFGEATPLFEEAIEVFSRLIKQTDMASVEIDLANTINNLGIALRHQGKFDESIRALTRAIGITSGTELYLHFDIGSEINLQNGEDSDGTLGLVVDLPGERRLAIDFRERKARLNGKLKEFVPWSQIAFTCLPTYASERYELRLELGTFGLKEGDEIKLNFTGSDELQQAVSIVLHKRQDRPSAVTLAKNGTDDVRIANLNTLRQGLSDSHRSASIKRLLAAANADIFCFQEEWEEGMFHRAAPLMIPSADARPVNLHWSGGCGIASPLPLEPIPMEINRAAAAAIELPGQNYVVVVSVHFKCCGYTGSREDRTRVQQAQQLVRQIQRLRNGEFGEKLSQAGIVIIGDYNLVGSRQPLDIIKTAGNTDWILPGMGDGAAFTWRGLRSEESFWPGRLDVVTYDPATLKPSNGCIVDTSRLSEMTLRELKLSAQDSLVSDHLLLVADFQLVR